MIKTLSDALAERGYDTLTAVQQAVTAPELQEADLLVSAQTGSGKTVGFGLAIAPTLLGETETLAPAAAPMALVVAPTRELAFQVMRELSWLYAGAAARVVSCVGGMDMRDERRALDRGAHIVVGTPGRLRDHIQRGSLDMTALRAVVLDEADEMLDLGFREDLEFMLGEAPADRRTLMFSATVPPMIATLAKQYQRDAVRVTTTTGTTQHADIAYQALRVAQADAENAIINLLRYHEAQNAIVFANTRMAVNRLTARFANRGFAVVSLSGELSQTERTHALQAMRDGRARVCVATDVAARGIDLPNLELVVHADLPSNPESLLHRSGRTGRAGRKGISALIVTPKIVKKAERLLKSAKITAEWTTAPSPDDVLRRDEERLLADPVWTEEVTEEQATFAAKLLDLHSPDTIAAAYLRLYRSRHSAPEDLSPPEAVPPRKERAPFGPSAWVALSVGRDDRAEARWLLPLLCRTGGLTKDQIGAIRVQAKETFVELAQPAVAGFMAGLGEGGVLEDGVTVRALEGAPDIGAPQGDRPRRPSDKPRPVVAPRARREDSPRPKPAADSRPPRRDPAREAASQADRPVHAELAKPVSGKTAAVPAKPKAPKSTGTAGDSPKSASPERSGEARAPSRDGKARIGKPRGDGPDGEGWVGKPRGDKPAGKAGTGKAGTGKAGTGKTRSDRPRTDKPAGKGATGKPRADKPAGKSGEFRPGAADSSKRFARPGKPQRPGGAKPGKAPQKGGNEPPRRGKR